MASALDCTLDLARVQKAARRGDGLSRFILAAHDLLESRFEKAFAGFAGIPNCPRAEYFVSVCYRHGWGVAPNHALANQFLLRAAVHGSARAKRELDLDCEPEPMCAEAYQSDIIEAEEDWRARSDTTEWLENEAFEDAYDDAEAARVAASDAEIARVRAAKKLKTYLARRSSLIAMKAQKTRKQQKDHINTCPSELLTPLMKTTLNPDEFLRCILYDGQADDNADDNEW